MVKKDNVSNKKLVGLGGWLIVFQIIFYITLWNYFSTILVTLVQNFTPANNPVLDQGRDSFLRQMLAIDLVSSLIFGSFLVYLLILMYCKRKKFVPLTILYTWLVFVTDLMVISYYIFSAKFLAFISVVSEGTSFSQETLMSFTIGIISFTILLGLAWAIVVTLYFKKSIRVKNTFIN